MPKNTPKNKKSVRKNTRRKASQKPSSFSQKLANGMFGRMLGFFHERPLIGYLALTMILMFSIASLEYGAQFLKGSVLEAQLGEFDGTAMPLQKVPNWIQTGGSNDRHYSDYSASELTNFMPYNITQLNSSTGDAATINAQRTYPVVYLGNYQLEHTEEAGSHLATDIRTACGTPAYAVASGIVEKAVQSTGGFGNQVVIKVPEAPVDGRTETIYIGYAHLETIDVSTGQIVRKGQKIGTVGDTGTATTCHIHFQIDRGTAPFHMYWPFTSSEASSAGLSFFEAINEGLGQANAKKYTINPMPWVQQHLNYNGGGGTTPPIETDTPPVIDTPPLTTAALDDFEITVSASEVESGAPVTLTITALDEDGEVFAGFNEQVEFIVSDGDVVKPALSFKSGVALAEITTVNPGRVKFTVQKEDIAESIRVTVLPAEDTTHSAPPEETPDTTPDTDSNLSKRSVYEFEVSSDSRTFVVGVPKTFTAKTLDDNGDVTGRTFHGVVDVIVQSGSAKVEPPQLTSDDFVNGEATIIVTPQHDTDLMIKLHSGILVGLSKMHKADQMQIFSDVSVGHKNAEAIAFLKEREIIGGYADGTFKPEDKVNRAEIVKMLTEAMNKTIQQGTPDFPDVQSSDWFRDYVYTALMEGIVSGYPDSTFRPNNNIIMAEFFKVLLEADDAAISQNIATDPFQDVSAEDWYAAYAAYAKENELLDFGNFFNPEKAVTRGEVAEALYRLLK